MTKMNLLQIINFILITALAIRVFYQAKKITRGQRKVLEVYIARDLDDRLFAYNKPPVMPYPMHPCWLGAPRMQLPHDMMPEVTYETQPQKVQITIFISKITEKQNGKTN